MEVEPNHLKMCIQTQQPYILLIITLDCVKNKPSYGLDDKKVPLPRVYIYDAEGI